MVPPVADRFRELFRRKPCRPLPPAVSAVSPVAEFGPGGRGAKSRKIALGRSWGASGGHRSDQESAKSAPRGPKRAQERPKRRPEASRRPRKAFLIDFKPMLDHLGLQKTLKSAVLSSNFDVFAISLGSFKKKQKLQKEAPGKPKLNPGGSRTAPKTAQEAPRAAQDASKNRLERPKKAPRAPRSRFQSGLGSHLGPTWRPRASQRDSASDFGPPGVHFGPSESRFSRQAACTKRGRRQGRSL